MIKLLGLYFLACLVVPAWAHEAHTESDVGAKSSKPHDLAMSVAFDKSGRLWRACVKAGRVLVDYSDNKGKSFSQSVAVNNEPQKIGAEGEMRPKIAIGMEGNIYVTWTQALDKPYSGHIHFSRSSDGGLHFSQPIVVNDNLDVITHRFDSLTVADDGAIYIAWIDKRDLEKEKAQGRKYEGAAVYYAVSSDGGLSFRPNIKAADHSCECCRIAMAPARDGGVAMFWRHVFADGARDHAMAHLTPQSASVPVRATFDHWNIDACPHHGPAMARGGDWGWHLAWFNGAAEHQGLFYARMDGAAWVSSPPKPFGNSAAQAAHPSLLSLGEHVFLSWKELTEDATLIMLTESDDGGRTWNAAREIARTSGAADYPFLVTDGKGAYLSWNTQQEGYRLIVLAAPGNS